MFGRVKEAIREYEVQSRLADDDARAHSDLGSALLFENDFARAVGELKRAIELDPKRATFRNNLGYAYQQMSRTDEAMAEYRQAIKLDDKLGSAWLNLATLLARDPSTRGECARAEKARAIDPSDPAREAIQRRWTRRPADQAGSLVLGIFRESERKSGS